MGLPFEHRPPRAFDRRIKDAFRAENLGFKRCDSALLQKASTTANPRYLHKHLFRRELLAASCSGSGTSNELPFALRLAGKLLTGKL